MYSSAFIRSSLIESVGYKDFKLLINFKNGTSYLYYDVPYEIYSELLHCTSPGKVYNSLIKSRYRCVNIGKDKERKG